MAVTQPAPLVGLRAGALSRHALPEHRAGPRLGEGDGWGDTLAERTVAEPARDGPAGRGLAHAFRPVAPCAVSPADPPHDEARSAQLGFGLLFPFLIVSHVVGTRIEPALTGVASTYADQVRALWITAPMNGGRQAAGAAGRLGSRMFRLLVLAQNETLVSALDVAALSGGAAAACAGPARLRGSRAGDRRSCRRRSTCSRCRAQRVRDIRHLARASLRVFCRRHRGRSGGTRRPIRSRPAQAHPDPIMPTGATSPSR